jgi:hypothetical protein
VAEEELRLTAVSIAGESAQFPSFTLARPESRDSDGLRTVAERQKVVISIIRPLGDARLTLTLLVELARGGAWRCAPWGRVSCASGRATTRRRRCSLASSGSTSAWPRSSLCGVCGSDRGPVRHGDERLVLDQACCIDGTRTLVKLT